MKKEGFANLFKNIETTIYEGLLKLGYSGDESFGIYYDLDLLNHLLQTEYTSKNDMNTYLQSFVNYANNHLNDLSLSLEKGRFKFSVARNGIAYIMQSNKHNSFLKDLITKVNSHNFTLEDILNIFKQYSNDFICEEVNNSEFQYVIYFTDTSLDHFKYCFNFDEMGGYYHRLLDYSYEKSLHE